MPFAENMLQPIGGQARSGNGARIWSYTTTDNEAAVNTAGYFADQRFAMRIGDIIFRTTLDGNGAHVETGLHIVTIKTPRLVTCTTAVLQVSTGTGLPTTGGTLTGFLGLVTDLSITATGANQGAAYPIDAQFNRINGGAADTGVILPAVDGVEIKIRNDTATVKKVYPPVGGSIDGLTANEPLELPAGLPAVFVREGTEICSF